MGELSEISMPDSVSVITRVKARNFRLFGRLKREFEVEQHGTDIRLVPVFPHRDYPLLRGFTVAANVLMIVMSGLLYRSASRFSSIYSHNQECTLAGLVLGRLFGVPVTADIHGDEVEENVAANGWKQNGFRHRFWKMIEGVAIRRSDLVICVSNAHKNYLYSTYQRRGWTEVVPCCVSEEAFTSRPERDEVFRAFGIPNRAGVWLLYSGSVSKYQLLDRVSQFHQGLAKAGLEANLLLLISDPESAVAAAKAVSGAGLERVVMLSVAHKDVPQVSCVTDVALLFREDLPLNRISSPTKFAEYLAAGVPVIITPFIGDYSTAVGDCNLGQVVNIEKISDPAYASEVMALIAADATVRDRCREYARSNLTWNSYSAILMKAYCLDGAGNH